MIAKDQSVEKNEQNIWNLCSYMYVIANDFKFLLINLWIGFWTWLEKLIMNFNACFSMLNEVKEPKAYQQYSSFLFLFFQKEK